MSATTGLESLARGEVFAGRYQVVAPLGEGGMGAVFEVFDEIERRPCALKLLSLEERSAAERFEHEFRTLKGLKHRNVVRLFDCGQAPLPYYTMELLRGRRWNEALAHLPLEDPARARAILRSAFQVFDALIAIHGAGIVHRDLKPENVLLVRGGLVKVIDFGVMWRRSRSWSGPTQTYQVIGTAGYIPPEALSEGAGRVDARGDLYSVGVALYELAAGRMPFEIRGIADLHRSVREEAPAVTVAGRAVDPVLAAICQKLLRKDPEQRFQSALDVLRALPADLGLKAASLRRHRSEAGAASAKQKTVEREAQVVVRLPLVGRDEETKRCKELLAAARKQKEVRAVLLRGPMGIGKTRLVGAFEELAGQRRFDVHRTSCVGEEYVPYGDLGGFTASLRRGLQREGVAFPPELTLVEYAGNVADLNVTASARLDTERRTSEGLRYLLRTLAGPRGQVLLFDDWQRAQRRVVDLVEGLLDGDLAGAVGHGFVVLLSYRPEELMENVRAYRLVARLAEQPATAVFDLDPLGRAQVDEAAAGFAGIEAVTPAVLDWLYNQTGGHPRFVEEALEDLGEGGRLAAVLSGEAPLELKALTDTLSLAPFLRLQWKALPSDARWLLELVAHTKAPLDRAVLGAACGFDRKRFERALCKLLRVGLIEEQEEALRLRCEALRELLVARTAVAAHAHRRWIATLVRLVGLGREDLVAYLAEHLWQCRDGPGIVSYVPRAVAWLKQRREYAPALEWQRRYRQALEQGLGETRHPEAERIHVALRSADLLYLLGHHQEAYAEYQVLVELEGREAPEGLDAALWVEGLNGLVRLEARRGESEAAERHARESLARAERLRSPAVLSDSLLAMGQVWVNRGDWRRGLGFAVKSLRAARAARDSARQSRALSEIGVAMLHRGLRRPAYEHFNLAHAYAKNAEDDRMMASALSGLGAYHWQNEEWEEALAAHRASMSYREKLAEPYMLAYGIKQLAIVAMELAEWGEAERLFGRARELYERSPDWQHVGNCELGLAECALRQGELEAASGWLEAILGRGATDRFLLADARVTCAQVAEKKGQRQEAREQARRALVEARALADAKLEGLALLVLARAGEEVTEELEGALRQSRRKRQAEMVQQLAHELGQRAMRAGEAERARQRMQEANRALMVRCRRRGRHQMALLKGPEGTAIREDLERAERLFRAERMLYPPSLIGRDLDLERLTALLDGARRQRTFHVVLVRGPIGCGRTRILEQLQGVSGPQQGFDAHLSYCVGDLYVPYGDLSGLGESMAAAMAHWGLEVPAELSPLPYMTSAIELAERGDPTASDPTKLRLRILDGFQLMLRTLLGKREQMLLFDDWHRAEPRAVELVDQMIAGGFFDRSRPDGGLVLVFSYRPELLQERPEAAAVLEKLAARVAPVVVEPQPLTVAEVGRFVDSMAQVRTYRAEAVGWLHEKTEGKPELLEDVVKVLNQRGELKALLAGKIAPEELKALPLPGSLELLVHNGWDQMDEEVRWLVAMLLQARLGVDAALLERASGFDPERFGSAYGRLLQTGLVLEAGRGGLRFYHHQMGDVLRGLDEVGAAASRAHARWLATLEGTSPAPGEEMLPHLAHHACEAKDAERMGHYLPQSGDWLRRLHQLEPALEMYRRYQAWMAASATAAPVREQVRVAGACGAILELLGRYDEALGEYRAMVALCDGSQAGELEPHLEIEARKGLGSMELRRGELEQGERHIREAMARAEQIGSRELVAASLAQLGFLHGERGDWRRALGYAVKSLRVARAGRDKRGEAAALRDIGAALVCQGLRAPAHEFLTHAHAHAKILRDDHMIARAHNALGKLHWANGELDEARKAHQEAIAYRERVGDIPGLAYALEQVGILSVEFGEATEAEQLLKKARGLYEKCGDRLSVAGVDLWLAESDRRQGKWDSARSRLDSILRPAIENARHRADALHLRAKVAWQQGEAEDVRRYARQGLLAARKIAYRSCEALCLLLLARCGEASIGELDGAMAEPRRTQDEEVIVPIAHYLATRAWEAGDDERARSLFEEAARAVTARARRLGRRRAAFLQSVEVVALYEDLERFRSRVSVSDASQKTQAQNPL